MVSGQRSVVSGQWSAVSGQWSLWPAVSLWSVVSGHSLRLITGHLVIGTPVRCSADRTSSVFPNLSTASSRSSHG